MPNSARRIFYHKKVLQELGLGTVSEERPTAVILYPSSFGDQRGGLDLQAPPDHHDFLHAFEVDTLRIPVSLAFLSFPRPQDAA
jgi:hypothetical protein